MNVEVLKRIHTHFPVFYSKLKHNARIRYRNSQKNMTEMKILMHMNKNTNLGNANLRKVKELINHETRKVTKMESLAKIIRPKSRSLCEVLEETNKQIEFCKQKIKNLNEFLNSNFEL